MDANCPDKYHAVITGVEPAEPTPGPLMGKRLLVKDLIDTAGIRTTYGSIIYGDHIPTRSASAVKRLVDAGAVIVGKANLDEFAWGLTNQNPWYGTAQNPSQPDRTTGGSSGGNAAALAAGYCEIGLGTDTGGSIRLPASCCGVVGLKPSWGRIPHDGVYPLCRSFDTVCPIATSASDVALMWSVLTQAPLPQPRLRGLTIGLLTHPPSAGRQPLSENRSAEQYVSQLEDVGARVVETTIPAAPGDTWPLFFYEVAEAHRETFPTRGSDYGDAMQRKLARAHRTKRQEVEAARESIRSWREYRPDVDLYVTPVIGREPPPVDCDEREVAQELTAFLHPFNVLGWAAIAIHDLQFVAPTDERVIAAALAWERAFST